jgi:hypothetical protein
VEAKADPGRRAAALLTREPWSHRSPAPSRHIREDVFGLFATLGVFDLVRVGVTRELQVSVADLALSCGVGDAEDGVIVGHGQGLAAA